MKRLRKKTAFPKPGPAPQGVPMPFQYRLTGESMDYLGSVLYQKRLLGKTRGIRSAPDNPLRAANMYFGDLRPWSGLLPTDNIKKRVQGKQAASIYKNAF